MSGIKGYFCEVTMSTDSITDFGGTKELFAASSVYNTSNELLNYLKCIIVKIYKKMALGAILGIGGSLISGFMGASAASRAAQQAEMEKYRLKRNIKTI